MRAKEYKQTEINARSRSRTRSPPPMASRSWRAASALRTGVFPFLDDVRGAAHGGRWVDLQHVPQNQPVEQHPQRGQVLLDPRGGEIDA